MSWPWIYFVTLIILGAFFVLNLVLGVLNGFVRFCCIRTVYDLTWRFQLNMFDGFQQFRRFHACYSQSNTERAGQQGSRALAAAVKKKKNTRNYSAVSQEDRLKSRN